MSLHDLPPLNAILNSLTTIALLMGFTFIRKKKVIPHRICMGIAVFCSVCFLTSYLTYHFHFGTTRFAGEGWARPVYFSILFSHTLLAALTVPLVILTLSRALRSQFDRHRKIARWTLPIWLYVSITGVVIYLFLYRFFPGT